MHDNDFSSCIASEPVLQRHVKEGHRQDSQGLTLSLFCPGTLS